MKFVYSILLTLFITNGLIANTITAKKNGNWDNITTWNPARTPVHGDTIIISLGDTVTVPGQFDLDNVVIRVYGMLDLDNGKLKLNDNSKVVLESGGRLTGHGNDDQLRIGNTTKYKGSGGLTGYAYADNTTGPGFVTGTLPVIFQTFYVTRQGSNNQLSWSTSEEQNNNYYAIEKSTDSRNWKQIATITGAGNSSLVNKYGYTDKNSNEAVTWYRIRQADMNGKAFYSAIRSLRNNENGAVTNIFTSSNKTITIDFNSDVKDNVSIQLINMNGQVIVQKEFSKASYRLIVNAMSAGSGVYAVRVSDGKGWSEVKRIML